MIPTMPNDPPRSLAEARNREGLSQQDVAELLGVHQSTVSRLETGKRDPNLDLIPKLMRLYRLSWDEMYRLLRKARPNAS